MIRLLTNIGLLLALWACISGTIDTGARGDVTEGDASISDSSTPPDTVYVARYNPVEVTYVSQLDTLFVTASTERTNQKIAEATSARKRSSEVTIGGFVMNETRSVIGRDFYDAFYDHWDAPKEATNFMVRVDEQPVPRFGTRVIVRVEDTEVFQSHLKPRARKIEKAARQAASQADLYLRKYHRPRKVY